MDVQPNNLPRPPTSRPKTAGRNAERPTTAAMQRPASRRLNTAEHVELEPAEGVRSVFTPAPPPQSALGYRTPSRGGNVALPASRAGIPSQGVEGRLGTAANLPSGQIRPTTQQGFIAQRPQSRLATGMAGRQVADKTYYIGLLNTQLGALQKEIDSLSNELLHAEREQQNLLVYEQKAEEQANEIKRLQGELADYNLIIDRQNTTSDMRDLEFDVQEEQKRTEELNSTIEELFRERREREELAASMEQQFNESKRQNAEFLNNLDPELKTNYEEAKVEAEELRRQLDDLQSQLDQLNKVKEDLDFQLANSSLKQQAMFLHEQISELELKKADLERELNSNDTPEEHRAQLIEQIRRNNEDITHIQQQITELNEQVSLAQEELREFESEFEMIAGEKNERYRDLKLKERQLDEFLGTFDVQKLEVEANVTERQGEIVRLLRQISANCQRDELVANVTAMDESFIIGNTIETNASAGELQDLHVRLQEEMITLNEAEQRLNAEMESMTRQQAERRENSVNLADFDRIREESMTRTRELHEQASELGIDASGKEEACARLSSQLSAIVQRLSQSPHFPKLRELRRRLEIAEDERKELRTQLDAKLAEVDYQRLKDETMRLRTEYNQLLVDGR